LGNKLLTNLFYSLGKKFKNMAGRVAQATSSYHQKKLQMEPSCPAWYGGTPLQAQRLRGWDIRIKS
jgi:hypothetical protein